MALPPRLARVLALGLALLVVAAVGVTVGSVDRAAAVSLCDSGEQNCVDVIGRTTAPAVSVLPVEVAGDGQVTLVNGGLTGETEVALLGYVTGESGGYDIVAAGPDVSGAALVAPGASGDLAPAAVPGDIAALVVQTGSSYARERFDDSARECRADEAETAGKACRSALVEFASRHDPVSRAQLKRSLAAWVAASGGEQPSDSDVSAFLDALDTWIPAHLAATVTAAEGALVVDWQLEAGTERVTSVMIERLGASADGSPTAAVELAPETGTHVLGGLVPGQSYEVDVSIVIAGSRAGNVALTGIPTAPPAAEPAPSASAEAQQGDSGGGQVGSTTGLPDTPPGWTRLFAQDFTADVATGSFDEVYRGWASYDGSTDTSRDEGRPVGQAGLWTSKTTSRVHDGVFDCHLHTLGVQPQVCALTPTLDGSYWSGQMYGRYTVRFKSDAVPGYKIAWLLWPGSDDWTQGEIDFPEASLDGTMSGSVHRVDGNPAELAYFVDTGIRMTDWHEATIEWVPGRITFLVDGQSWTTTDPGGLPTNPMRWALQAETEIQAQAPSSSAQGHILIDWLVGYSYTP